MVIDVITGVGVGVREIRPVHYSGQSCVFRVRTLSITGRIEVSASV
jgi:hypothetical protein